MDETDTFWFRPKRYGYGVEPKNGRGWLASGLFIVAAASVAWFGLVAPAVGGQEASTEQTALGWGALIAITTGFVWFCHRRTDGPWRWRWGQID